MDFKLRIICTKLFAKLCLNIVFDNQVAKCFSRRLHASRVMATAMSKFDPSVPLPYSKLRKNYDVVKKRLNKPMSLAEKILYSHIDDAQGKVKVKRSLSVTHW